MPETPEPIHRQLTLRMIEATAEPGPDHAHPLVTDHRLTTILDRLEELVRRAETTQTSASPFTRVKAFAAGIVRGQTTETELDHITKDQLIEGLRQLDERTLHQRSVIAELEQRLLRLESGSDERPASDLDAGTGST